MIELKLSIVIVNYNVRYFLENCLHSVIAAIKGIDAEIIVVDNASKDDSQTMMADVFPEIKYLYLENNVGFSKGNNVGIEASTGAYVLLLNPDTVVQEDTFRKCLDFLDNNPNTGGLGVKMIDGNGNFLPESKRGMPTPIAAFYKIFGLSTLMPKSRVFGKYHLGFLDENEIHDVDILSGAFMMMRRSALEKVGLLDETFFMYGEDIDLSYRITKGGYKNFYFPKTAIVHYKGESTKKGSLNYVFVFYRAMIIFSKKHFDSNQASIFNLIINLAIYFRAFLALIWRLGGRLWQFFLDFTAIYFSFLGATFVYGDLAHKDFTLPIVSILIPVFAFILSSSLYFSGTHDHPFKINRMLRGWFVGITLLLALYSLLPETLRFSRAVVLIGSTSGLLLGIIWRWVISRLPNNKYNLKNGMGKRRIVVGNSSSFNKVKSILDSTGIPNEFLAGISINNEKQSGFLGHLSHLNEAIKEFRIDELIIDPKVSSYSRVIELLESAKGRAYDIKILNDSWFIGPNQIIRPHQYKLGNKLFNLNIKTIVRNKRVYDLLYSIALLLIGPILILFIDNKSGFVKNLFYVFSGAKSWVGYDARGLDAQLPTLKPSVIHLNMHTIWPKDHEEQSFNSNVKYLFSNMFVSDSRMILRHFHSLGN